MTQSVDRPWTLEPLARLVLAALSWGAGAIHLFMAPSHLDAWWIEGAAFVAVGLAQVALAIAFLVRPAPWVLRVSCVLSAGLITLWVVSRVSGLPIGPEAGEPHVASFVDVTCVALEAALLLVGYELLVRSDRGRRLGAGLTTASMIVPIGIVGVTVAALTSPSATNHAHHEHDHATAAHSHAAGHDHAAAETAFLFPDGDDAGWSAVRNGEEHGNHRPPVPVENLQPPVRRELEHQLALTMVPIQAYPTVADAEAAGYRRTGEFNPGLGVHYRGGIADMDGVLSDDEISHPSTIVYDGTAPDSPIVGFMYTSITYGGGVNPTGFAGPNDVWHTHSGICIRFEANGEIDALGDGGEITRDECVDQGAQFIDQVAVSLLHVWPVPAYTNPLGVFAHANPALRCEDGTYEFSAACQRK